MTELDLYRETLPVLERYFHLLEDLIDPPELVDIGFGEVFRYKEKGLKQAALQKLARVNSGLHACGALLERGLVQELAALQRMVDEFREDVFFLCQALLSGERTELHDRYLEYFYQEELDATGDALRSAQKRPQISRSKIQAANARTTEQFHNPSDAQELNRTLAKAYGGFVHGASPHIMEMYGGYAPQCHVSGMLGTPRVAEHADDLWNYFHRGINVTGLVAYALGAPQLAEEIVAFRKEFERISGRAT